MLGIEQNKFDIKDFHKKYKDGFITLVNPELESNDVDFGFDQVVLRIPPPPIHAIILPEASGYGRFHYHVFKGSKFLKQLFDILDGNEPIKSLANPQIDGLYFTDINIGFALHGISINVVSYHSSWFKTGEFDIALNMLNPNASQYFEHLKKDREQ